MYFMPKNPTMRTTKNIHQKRPTNVLSPTTILVGRGKSTPMLLNMLAKMGTTNLSSAPSTSQAILKEKVFLIGGENFQTLNQWKSGVNHHGKLAEENGQILDGNFAGAKL